MSRLAATGLALLLGVTVILATATAAHANRERDAQRSLNAITHEFGAGPTGACMWKVAWRESRLNPHAANLTDRHADGSTGSWGLFEIGSLWRRRGETVDHFRRRMMDPAANAREAHRLYRRYGLQPWGGYC